MLDDMAFGVMDWLERKVLTTVNDNFEKALRRKRDRYLKEKVLYEKLRTLNST